MAIKYHHKQLGKVIIISMAIGAILALFAFWLNGLNTGALIVAAVFLFSMLMFGTLTVEINEQQMIIKFGSGLIHKTVELKNIASARAVENPWWYGWGIHFTPSGTVFNVSGFDAVEITLKSGKTFRIGTDDPVGLEGALKKTII